MMVTMLLWVGVEPPMRHSEIAARMDDMMGDNSEKSNFCLVSFCADIDRRWMLIIERAGSLMNDVHVLVLRSRGLFSASIFLEIRHHLLATKFRRLLLGSGITFES